MDAKPLSISGLAVLVPWTAEFDTDKDGHITSAELEKMEPNEIAALIKSKLEFAAEDPVEALADLAATLPDEKLRSVMHSLQEEDIEPAARMAFAQALYATLQKQEPGRFTNLLLGMKNEKDGVSTAAAWISLLDSETEKVAAFELDSRDPEFAAKVLQLSSGAQDDQPEAASIEPASLPAVR